MPHAKFGPDRLKTVAVHDEQRNTFGVIYTYIYIYKIGLAGFLFPITNTLVITCKSIIPVMQ